MTEHSEASEGGPQTTFDDLGLRDSVLKGVHEAGFTHPTEIQAQLIPAVLSGRDVIGQAKTGTGKTAAFGLPLLHMLDKDTSMQALVLVPTRELASQVARELDSLGKHTPIRTSTIIGGESMHEQSQSVKRGGHIIVGTPGRIMDMHGRRQVHFRDLKFAILDEVDRMLDIGFRDDIRKILKMVQGDHQTVFVSATISGEIESLARSFMHKDALKITTAEGALTVALVDQTHIPVQPWDKKKLLLHLLKHEEPDTTLIFCRTKATVHYVTRYLRDKGVNAREIHGDLPQSKRNSVIGSLRSGSLDVVVASDLAARGLDIEHISHVINYDLPDDPEVYIHRIGRTARAGRRGIAWSFVCPDQGQLLTEIEKLAGVMIDKFDYPDFTPGPIPDSVKADQKKVERRSPMDTLAERAQPSWTDGLSEQELAVMFPNGVVPKTPPRRTLGTKFRSRRR